MHCGQWSVSPSNSLSRISMSTMLRSKKALRGRMMRCFLPDSLKIFLNPKSTMGSMYLRTFGKFFIICLRLIIAANIAKHRKRKTAPSSIPDDCPQNSQESLRFRFVLSAVDPRGWRSRVKPRRGGPGPLRGDNWGKEKLEEKMGMDATAARGKGVLWCPWQARRRTRNGLIDRIFITFTPKGVNACFSAN